MIECVEYEDGGRCRKILILPLFTEQRRKQYLNISAGLKPLPFRFLPVLLS